MPTDHPSPPKPSFRRRQILRVGLFLFSATAAFSARAQSTVKINVLSLFHPQTILLTTTRPATLQLDTTTFTLPARQPLRIEQTPTTLLLTTTGLQAQSTSLRLPETTFTVTVSARTTLTRTYRAALSLTHVPGVLQPVLTMPVEQAVAAIVAAEAAPSTPLEALKAQAVVSRSYLLAHPAHRTQGFDACDTTHCQWLGAAPPPTSPAAQATRATAGQVLLWQHDPQSPLQIVPARFSRATGSYTQTLSSPGTYPFLKVLCQTCRSRHTTRAGNGIGLCQQGAAELATRGRTYNQILYQYFPNTTVARHGTP